MDAYLLLVFLHVAAAAGLFAAVGVEVLALMRLRSADSIEQARTWLPSLKTPAGGLGHVSMLVILGTGIWMMIARWGMEAWMAMALATIVAMMLVGGLLGRPPVMRLASALEAEGSGDDWSELARSPRLHVATWLRVGLLVGILGFMTIKPTLLGSLVTVSAAGALGAGVGLRADGGRVAAATR